MQLLDVIKKLLGDWGAVTLYFGTLVLYVFDHSMDIIVGVSFIRGCHHEGVRCTAIADAIRHSQGRVILACCYLPVVATLTEVVIRKIFEHSQGNGFNMLTDLDYRYTLLGVDWLNEEREEDGVITDDENKGRKRRRMIKTIILMIFRMELLLTYYKFFRATYKRNKETDIEKRAKKDCIRKRYDIEFRASLFIEAFFEALPQCCIQIYIFGKTSVVSNAQIISFTLSVTSICCTFMLSEYYREGELWRNGEPSTDIRIAEISSSSGENCRNCYVRKWGKGDASIVFTKHKGTEALTTTFVRGSDKPPADVRFFLHFVRTKPDDDYLLRKVSVKSKLPSEKYRKTLFFYIRVCDIFIGGVTSFFTAIPAISLFSSLFGTKFMIFIIPIICQFAAQYWWWRPKMRKRNAKVSFQTLFFAYKMLLRVIVWGALCIWFLKVVRYSDPSPGSIPAAIRNFGIWPHPNAFLETVASYKMDGKDKDWKMKCHNMTSITYNSNKLYRNFNTLTSHIFAMTIRNNCAIDVDKYVFCVSFFMNIVGMIWECLHYALFMMMLLQTRANEWLEDVENNSNKFRNNSNEESNNIQNNSNEDWKNILNNSNEDSKLLIGDKSLVNYTQTSCINSNRLNSNNESNLNHSTNVRTDNQNVIVETLCGNNHLNVILDSITVEEPLIDNSKDKWKGRIITTV